MTPEQQAAIAKFKVALDQLFEEMLGAPIAATRPVSSRSSATPAKAAYRPFVAPTPPAPLTPAPKPGAVLSEDARKKHLPEATKVALKILKVIGDGQQLVPGVTGQLALERIPYDPTLVQQAIDAARRQL